MSKWNLVVCAECSATMDGLPIEELNRGFRQFVERIRMHSATDAKLNLLVLKYWDASCELLYEGPCGDYFNQSTSRSFPADRRKFGWCPTMIERPEG